MTVAKVEKKFGQLRSCSTDLSVILGQDEDEVTKWYHSQTLACKSKYIDAMLSTPMKEKAEKVLTFPDITLEVWDEMMRFLDSPVAVLRMTPRDALRVAIFYDKYEFVEGAKLCDLLLTDYFRSLEKMETDYSMDANLYVDAMSIAHEANLVDAVTAGIHYIWDKMRNLISPPYGSNMLTEKQMDKLLPVLLDALLGVNRSRYGFHPFPPDSGDDGTKNIYNIHLGLPIDEPGFSKIFISRTTHKLEADLLLRCISHIELTGAECEIDVGLPASVPVSLDGEFNKKTERDVSTLREKCEKYESPKKHRWGDYKNIFYIEKTREDPTDDKEVKDGFYGWAICTRRARRGQNNESVHPDKILWIAPCSANLNFPPQNGWKPFDPKAKGNPTMKYILNKEV